MHIYSIKNTADQSLVAATAKTLLQLVTGSTRRAKIKGYKIGFASTTSTDGAVLVELMLQTTAGTASAVTPSALDQALPAAIATAQDTVTAEPTASTVLHVSRVTPIGGTIFYDFPPGQEIVMAVSTRVGLRLTAPNNQASVRAELVFEE